MTEHKAETAQYEYGSVLPGETEPDVFYETFQEAVEDCAFGPCRIVRRLLGPWVPVGQSLTTPPEYTSPGQAPHKAAVGPLTDGLCGANTPPVEGGAR